MYVPRVITLRTFASTTHLYSIRYLRLSSVIDCSVFWVLWLVCLWGAAGARPRGADREIREISTRTETAVWRGEWCVAEARLDGPGRRTPQLVGPDTLY